jgi:hypothetical protein
VARHNERLDALPLSRICKSGEPLLAELKAALSSASCGDPEGEGSSTDDQVPSINLHNAPFIGM